MSSTRELFLEKVSSLTSKEKVYLLNVFKKHDIGYSKNSSGYFFNLSQIEDSILTELENYINLIQTNRKNIEENDHKREEEINYYANLLKNEELKKEKEEKDTYNDLLKLDTTSIVFEISKKKRYIQKIIEFDTSDDLGGWNKRKYKKNSLYDRLFSKFKKIKFNHNLDVDAEGEVDADGADLELEGDLELDVDVDVDVEGNIDGDVDGELEGDGDLDVDIDGEIDLDIDADIDCNDLEGEIEPEFEGEPEPDSEEEKQNEMFEEKLKFYKDILSSEGYIFSDAVLKLQIEEYV